MRRAPRAGGRRPWSFGFESLESRALLAATPVGGDLLINTFTPGKQATVEGGSAVALADNGDGVVVFEGRGASDRDGVFARRVSADGQPLGPDFRVNETTRERQGDASVAMMPGGGFVVVWAGRGQGDQDGVFMRIYNADGVALTGEILVNQTVAGRQAKPAVAVGPGGVISVAWEGNGAGDFNGVFLRRFSASGVSLVSEVLVNDPSPLAQSSPALAVQSDGTLLAVWSSHRAGGLDYDIMARRFDAAGTRSSPEFAVNSNQAGNQVTPAVAATGSGAYDIVWSSFGPSDAGWDVRYARVPATGAVTVEQNLSGGAAGNQTQPVIATARDRTAIVAWTSASPNGGGLEVVGRNIAESGTPLPGEFSLPARGQGFGSRHQFAPSLASSAAGALLAWSGKGSADSRGVYVRALSAEAAENRPPNLADIEDKTVVAGTELTFTAAATDPDGDTITFSLDPDQAPAGATINPATGVFRWTPPAGQTPSPVTVRIIATDDGNPALADSETFTINVTAPPVNEAPNLQPIANKTIEEGNELTFTAIATDPNQNQITYMLDTDADAGGLPAGATINPSTGVFRWTPTEAQGPKTYTFRVIAIDNGNPALADSETFTVEVTEHNSPPNLTKPANVSAARGSQVGFTASATDPDSPANELRFSIDPDTNLPGMTIDPVSGQFMWAVPQDQTPGQYTIRIFATDNGEPALADSETFVVTVQ
jgi:hypothetical protein